MVDDAVAADDDDDAALPVDVAAAAAARCDGRSRRRRRLVELGVAAGARWLTSSPSLSDVPSATSSASSLLPKACPTPRRKAVKSFRPHRRSLISVVSRRVFSVTLRR